MPDSPEPKFNALETIVYMLLSIEAKVNANTELLIEVTDILTQKDPGQVKAEYVKKAIEEHKRVLERMTSDRELLDAIKKMIS